MRDATLLGKVEAATRHSMLDAGPRVEVPRGGFLVHDGDPEANVYLVLEGLLKVVKTSYHGEVSFLALRRAGTLVGELAALMGAPRSSAMQAVRSTTVVRIGQDRFEQLLSDHPDLGRVLLTEIADCIRDATMQIHDLMNADGTTRVAARLIRLADDIVDDHRDTLTLSLPIPQEELGEWAGLSRAGTAKALRALRTAGLVQTSRMSIMIKDLPALRAVAIA